MGAGAYTEEMTFRRGGPRDVAKQHVHAFQCLFPSSYKADAHVYNLIMEDIQSLLKSGWSIHGEWFLGGKRFPREDGHEVTLEEEDGLADMNEEEARILTREGGVEIEELLVKTDTCQAQFGGRNNIGRIGEQQSGHLPEHTRNISMTHTFSEPYHGKCICDAMSNVPANELRRAGARGSVFPGTRQQVSTSTAPRPPPARCALCCVVLCLTFLWCAGVFVCACNAAQVLHLARELQTPGILKSKKVEWWAVSNYVWGFLDTDNKRLPKKPDFTPLPGSKRVAMYQSVPVSGLGSRARYRRRHCACTGCLHRSVQGGIMGAGGTRTPNDGACHVLQDPKFKHMVGPLRQAFLQRRGQGVQTTIQLRSRASAAARTVAAQVPEEEACLLEHFAKSFVLNEVVAVNVANDDKDMYGEGEFWLAVVTELPKRIESTIRHSGSMVERGSWGVRCLWLQLVSTRISDEGEEERHYRIAGHNEVVLDVRMVLQLPDADGNVSHFYEIGRLEDRSGEFILLPNQTAHINACLGEMESALRDTDVGGRSDAPASDEDGDAAE